jgi:hypothetical protein
MFESRLDLSFGDRMNCNGNDLIIRFFVNDHESFVLTAIFYSLDRHKSTSLDIKKTIGGMAQDIFNSCLRNTPKSQPIQKIVGEPNSLHLTQVSASTNSNINQKA